MTTGRVEDAGLLCGVFEEQFRVIGSAPQADEAERHAATRAEVARTADADPLAARGASLSMDEAATLARDVLHAARTTG